MRRLLLRLIELYCVLFDHRYKQCGSETWTEYGHEYDEWWECTRCKNEMSNCYDLTTFVGRLKSWWYQE